VPVTTVDDITITADMEKAWDRMMEGLSTAVSRQRPRVTLRQWLGLAESLITAGGARLLGVYPTVEDLADVFDLLEGRPTSAHALPHVASYFFHVPDAQTPNGRPAPADVLEAVFSQEEMKAELRAAFVRNLLLPGEGEKPRPDTSSPEEPNWGETMARLAERYGFTPADVRAMTWPQVRTYLNFIADNPSTSTRMVEWHGKGHIRTERHSRR
jgi:hypothetical protein